MKYNELNKIEEIVWNVIFEVTSFETRDATWDTLSNRAYDVITLATWNVTSDFLNEL